MQKICSKCGSETIDGNDLHCRKILVDQISDFLSPAKHKEVEDREKYEEAAKLVSQMQGDEIWEKWKREMLALRFRQAREQREQLKLEEKEKLKKEKEARIIEINKFKYNILGCMRYDDFNEVGKWFAKAQQEIQSDDFWQLTNNILEHFLSQYDFSTAEKIQQNFSEKISLQVYEGLKRYYKKEPFSAENFKDRIVVCIKQYQDYETAKYWLEEARCEMENEEYQQLINDILEHFLSQYDFSTAEEIKDKLKEEILIRVYETLDQHYREQIIVDLTNLFADYNFSGAEQFYKQHSDAIEENEYNCLLNNAKEKQQKQLALSQAKNQFAELANKCNVNINEVVNESGPTQLAKILNKFNDKESLDEFELKWLEENKKFELLANYYYQHIERFGCITDSATWELSKASKFFIKADMPGKAVKITDSFSDRPSIDQHIIIRDSIASGAVYTSRGAAFRRLQNSVKAKECANKAISLSPQSFYPYNLLGAISYDEGECEEGDKYFEKAIKLGSDPRVREMEIKGVLQKSTNIGTRQAIIDYLLLKDPEKYAWTKQFQL